jgi:hypothetical protein
MKHLIHNAMEDKLMNSLKKSFLSLALLLTVVPAVMAMDGAPDPAPAPAPAPADAKGWFDGAKETVKGEYNLFTSWTAIKAKFNEGLKGKAHVIGLPLAALTIPAIVAYKYNSQFRGLVDKAAGKTKAGYNSFVDYVKANKSAQYALAGTGAAAAGVGLWYMFKKDGATLPAGTGGTPPPAVS